jgi:hypothetical protein
MGHRFWKMERNFIIIKKFNAGGKKLNTKLQTTITHQREFVKKFWEDKFGDVKGHANCKHSNYDLHWYSTIF